MNQFNNLINEYIPSKKYLFGIGLALLIMSVLAFYRLGDRFMWIDEGYTAQLGKNILEFGYPRAWDGINLTTMYNGNDFFSTNFINVKETWLPFYIAAFGQIFGNSNFCLRFWFVVSGILSALIFYILACRLTSPKIALLALWLYALSIPILYYIRNVRYYSVGLLFLNLTYLSYTYLRYTENTDKYRRHKWIFFTASSILLFYSFYMFFGIAMVVIFITFLLFDHQYIKWKKFLLSMFIICITTFPFYFLIKITEHSIFRFLGLYNLFFKLTKSLWQINTYFFPFIVLGFIWIVLSIITNIKKFSKKPKVGYGFDGIQISQVRMIQNKNNEHNRTVQENHLKKLSQQRNICILFLTIFINLLLIFFFVGVDQFRYLIPSIPALYLFTALLISSIYKKQKLIGGVVTILIIFTNILHISPYLLIKACKFNPKQIELFVKSPLLNSWMNTDLPPINWQIHYNLASYLNKYCYIQSYLMNYLLETNYDDATEGTVKFLWKYANLKDTIIYSGMDPNTITYYTGLKIAYRLDPNFPLKWADKYPNVEKYGFLTNLPEKIDWIIMRTPIYVEDEQAKSFFNFFYQDPNYGHVKIVEYPEGIDQPEMWHNGYLKDKHFPDFFYIFWDKRTKPDINFSKAVLGKADLDSF